MAVKRQNSLNFFRLPDDGTGEAEDIEAAERVDPASLLAEVMLARMLQAVTTLRNNDGQVGAVTTVRTVSAAWTKLTARAWAVLLHSGAEHLDVDSGRAWYRGAWLAYVRPVAVSKPPLRGLKKDPDEEIQRALWNGLPIVGFAPDEALLPDDLVQAADRQLLMPRPSSADVEAVVERLCEHTPTDRLTDEEAAALTPRLVRLACRMG